VDKGNRGGLGVIGDSSVGGVEAGVCPEVAQGKADSTIATAWWCSGSTYRGTLAHELGHTFGLPHPDAFRKGFRCADSTAYTIMQCHWMGRAASTTDRPPAQSRLLSIRHGAGIHPAPRQRPLSAVGSQVSRLERRDSLVWLDGRGAARDTRGRSR
jgi:hypothetical protein